MYFIPKVKFLFIILLFIFIPINVKGDDEILPNHSYETILTNDGFILGGQSRIAQNEKCELKLEYHGNLVVTRKIDSVKKVAWQSFSGQDIKFLDDDLKFYLQGDGNLVIYGRRIASQSYDVIWRSRTNMLQGLAPFQYFELRFDEDCRLVLVGSITGQQYTGPLMQDCKSNYEIGTIDRSRGFIWASVRNRDEEIYVRGLSGIEPNYSTNLPMIAMVSGYPVMNFDILPQGVILNNIWGGVADGSKDLSAVVTKDCNIVIFNGNDLADLTSDTVVWTASPNFKPNSSCYLHASTEPCDIALYATEYDYPHLNQALRLWSFVHDDGRDITCGNDRGFVIGFNANGFQTDHMSWCGTPQFGYPWW